jgi:predicted membrane metal-binding protein
MERRIHKEAITQGRSSAAVSVLTIGLAVVFAILLATKVYWMSELFVFLLLAAILCLVGACIALLLVFLREGIRWSITVIQRSKRIVELPMDVQPDYRLASVGVPQTARNNKVQANSLLK